MEQGQWGWSCCPVPGWDGIFCCKTCCAPAEGSRHQGKKPSRESASHEKEVLKTAWKQPGSASAGSSRAGSSGDSALEISWTSSWIPITPTQRPQRRFSSPSQIYHCSAPVLFFSTRRI